MFWYIFSKNANQDQAYHQQCLSFLLAHKCVGETISLPEHRMLYWGGSWKVNKDVIVVDVEVCCWWRVKVFKIINSKTKPRSSEAVMNEFASFTL